VGRVGFLQHLQLAAPETAIVQLSGEFLARKSGGGDRAWKPPGARDAMLAFRIRYPGDPERVPVYDFVPDTILDRVENRNEFLGILVFDKWLRQCRCAPSIFVRARLAEYVPSFQGHALRTGSWR
jgi:hypothetical protein